jgi:phage/plasmid-associated DNA primase
VDLLFGVIGNNQNIRWKQWFLIAGILKSNGYDYEMFQLFTKISKTFKFTDQKREKTRKVWDSIGIHKHISIYALQNLAKDEECGNPTEYKKWLKKYNIYGATYEEINNPFNCAKLIQTTLKQNLIYCQKEWYMITANQLWKNQKEPTYYVLDEINKYLDFQRNMYNDMVDKDTNTNKKELLEKLEKWIGLYNAVTKPAYLSVLIKCLQPLLADDTFSNVLNANKGKLVFKNGIVDLETKQFTEGIVWYDFVSETIPYDYVPSEYIELKKILKPILNNNEEHLEYFLSILGYTFIGEADLQKSIYFMIDKTDCGKGDNGKTFFFDILNTLMPNYVYRSKASLLEINNTKVHKQIVMTKGKRLVWLEELPKEKYMNPQIMKEIGDGKTLENEIMYGTSESINVMFKMFALSNHIPKIDPNESAVYNRYKQISFNSHFDRSGDRKEPIVEELKFIADATLPDKVKTTMYNEVFSLIIDYANKFYKREKKLPTVPQQFLNDTKETQAVNDDFGLWFDEHCVYSEGDRVPLKLLAYKSQNKEGIIKEGMARKGFKYNKDLSKMGKDLGGKNYKGGFENVKMIVEETDEELE